VWTYRAGPEKYGQTEERGVGLSHMCLMVEPVQ